ncbi:LINE-1 reverse transcriptase [Willisornis vidua]|uniref:LINE-1 reverse transcriptase n=1 Tax=Willisornis vidua TaxID=1566151 RepID=A0ABQ9D0Q6_9PASS|nr:LINE-1 reverse transcriptase [Willisornis vidua]
MVRGDLVREVEIGGCLGYSDHEVIEFQVSADRRKSASKTLTLNMRKADFRLLRELGYDGPRRSQYPELEDHDCENDQLSVNPEIVWDLLLQLDPYKSMGLILQELADVITKPLSMTSEQSWKLVNVVLVFKKGRKEDPENYKLVSLTSVPGKVMEKIILRSIGKYLKDL